MMMLLCMVLTSGIQLTNVDPELDSALVSAGANRSQLEAALDQIPAEHRPGMIWLIKHMPKADRNELTSDFLLENVNGAYETWKAAPWRDGIPEDIFFDAILPYASINERRDEWRSSFHDQFAELVTKARTPSEAAAILNNRVFPMLGVQYSTDRPKPDQSPLESIEAGMASCTGLSVLLVDACRSVGVPARFVGTPLWSDGSGNHSWVEIYDDGKWHFTGAAEPVGMELDKAWFQGRAEGAIEGDDQRAILAVTWRKVPLTFPLPWKSGDTSVRAVDVTQRYKAGKQRLPEGMARIRVRVIDHKGHRESIPVMLRSVPDGKGHKGVSRDDRFDANDHLEFVLPIGVRIQIDVEGTDPVTILVEKDEQLITIKRPVQAVRPEDP